MPRNRKANITTLLSSKTMEGMGPSLPMEGATTAAVLKPYVERVLSPMLRPGQVVVMDNLTTHKGERVSELIEERGCELMYLPPYSPDFNPIEEAFAKIKGIVRKAEARSREALIGAIGQRSLRSGLGTYGASSSTADTVLWFKCFDCHCRTLRQFTIEAEGSWFKPNVLLTWIRCCPSMA